MVCSNMTVDSDEAGFKHNSNEVLILTAVVTFGNEKLTNTENIELLTQFFKDHEGRSTSLYKKTVIIESNDTYKIFCKPE